MKSGKVRMGVLGGSFGASFQWHLHPHSTVEAVCDALPERRKALQETYSCGKAYTDFDQLIADPDVDAVAICSGAPWHGRQSIAALKAGKHVWCAVPAAMSIEECQELVETVEKTGLTYMMGETSYYRQTMISARQWWREGRFGEIFYTEAEYHHAGLEPLFVNPDGTRSWRYAFPPMHYPTHCTAFLVGLTGERLTEVTCYGWGDDRQELKDNDYGNPFWNQTALFRTDRGHTFRVCIFWQGAHRGTERAQWYGTKMSFFMEHPNGLGPVIVRSTEEQETDDAGFVRTLPVFEQYEPVEWWKTEMLPEPLRVNTGHDGSHAFLTHEFVDALVNGRRPAIDVYEAVAYTAPGIIAHQSSLRDGEKLQIPQFDRR